MRALNNDGLLHNLRRRCHTVVAVRGNMLLRLRHIAFKDITAIRHCGGGMLKAIVAGKLLAIAVTQDRHHIGGARHWDAHKDIRRVRVRCHGVAGHFAVLWIFGG